jgi:16S rRNA processing protein RimM
VAAADNDDLVLVGRVARAHGNKGQVIVNPETDFPESRFSVGGVLLVGPEAAARAIRTVRFHLGRPIVSLEGVETMNDAEALAGAELRVPARALESLPEGTFYHHDLIGCDVVDTRGRTIGTVASVEGTVGASRLAVTGAQGEILIPLVADICERIDVAGKRIVVNPPEGLLELNSRSGRALIDADETRIERRRG